jgi:hypothetical protein
MPNHHLNDTELSSQSIFLHSNDAVVTISSAERIFYLEESITAPAGYRLLIGLTNLTMPNTMYNITDNNNTITINGNSTSITNGNYSADSLATKIQDTVSEVNTCSFDAENNVFSFTFTGSYVFNSSTMERQLGLRDQLPPTDDDGNIIAVSSYTASDVCDLGGITNIYIRLRNLTMNNLDSRGKTSNIVASIVNNTNYGGYIFYVPPEVLYYMIKENNISHLDIELSDQEGNLIDLNGSDFNMTFTIHYVKQRESTIRESMLQQIKRQYESKMKNKEEKNID